MADRGLVGRGGAPGWRAAGWGFFFNPFLLMALSVLIFKVKAYVSFFHLFLIISVRYD